jgi:hypothetical protein
MKLTTMFATAAIALSMASAQAMVVFSDGFEADPSGGTFATYNSDGSASGSMLTNWNVIQGSVDVVQDGFSDLNCNGNRCLDLDGTSPALGALILETKDSFTAGVGDTVWLTFDITDLNSGDFDPFRILFGSVAATVNAVPFQPVTFVISTILGAPINAPIRIEVLETPNNFGPIFDNVVLSITTASEPGFMLLGGLTGLAALRLARRRG